MGDLWTEAWAEAEASCPNSVLVFDTIELQHPAFLESGAPIPLRFVCDVEPRTFGIEPGATFDAGELAEFTPIAFSADAPNFSEQQVPQCRVVIDNVARDVMPYLEAAIGYRADLKVLFRQYREDDVSEPACGPWEFLLRKVTVAGSTVEGTASFDDLTNMKFPRRIYSRREFSSLIA
ncbi:DUF1833 family protein [Xanthobacter aminoxidans]|uniref:DUF1833 family protein n=1 Tax=Xanthobacter aminoxidans TaxID=186280 RepID=UPI00202306CB|nr:DUF1833 family protein [Xanthobacter aminoxidans]MCL8385474.1 DUF1833 domain-containing protein [Xanthobacter aminoxidans]